MNVVKPFGLVMAGVFALAGNVAQADDAPRFYAGVGYSHMTYDAGTAEYTMPITTLHVGVELNPNLRLEGRYGINAGDDEQDDNGWLMTYEVERYWAVLLRGLVPVTESVSVYGMAGLNSLSVDSHGRTLTSGPIYTYRGSASNTESTLGLGGEFRLGDSLALTAEYQWMIEDVSGFNVGLNYRF